MPSDIDEKGFSLSRKIFSDTTLLCFIYNDTHDVMKKYCSQMYDMRSFTIYRATYYLTASPEV